MKIICLDDHPTMLDSLVRELNMIAPEAEISSFRDTETALEFMEANGCDVLFCEIDLYGNDGIVFAEMVKELNPRVNIIFTTVCEEAERAKDIFKLHPSGYITKPYSSEQLSKELRNLRYPVSGCERIGQARYIRQSEYSFNANAKAVGEFSAAPSCTKPAYSFTKPEPVQAPPTAPVEPVPMKKPAAEPEAKPEPVESKANAMNAKDLRRLGRTELLEMLIAQTRENDKMKAELAKAKEELSSRNLSIENAGSIAQAALQINGVFESAQRAADQYLENIRAQSFQMAMKEQECAERSERLLAETRARCAVMESQSAKKCEEMVLAAEAETKLRWDELYEKMEAYLREHEQLRCLMMGYSR